MVSVRNKKKISHQIRQILFLLYSCVYMSPFEKQVGLLRFCLASCLPNLISRSEHWKFQIFSGFIGVD